MGSESHLRAGLIGCGSVAVAELIGVEIADFVATVRSGGKPLVSTREALNVQRILSGLDESGASGREIALV